MDPASNYKTPFMRLFSPFDDGPEAERSVDAMADAATGVNSIHGTINTHGCWSLFRNYNWPRAHFATFEAVYRAWRADQKRPDAPEAFAQDFPFPDDAPAGESPKEKQARISRRAKWKNRRKAQEALVAATKGETQLTPYDMSLASWHKFMLFDRNWAYYFLFRDLLGLVPNRHLAFVNVMETHGFRCRGNMPDAGKPPAGEQNAFTDDAFLDKTKTKREGLPVWGKNVFGDGPFDYALTKRATVKGKVVFRAENLAAASHMDLYLYAEAEEPFTRP
jgi:hypothetical protein